MTTLWAGSAVLTADRISEDFLQDLRFVGQLPLSAARFGSARFLPSSFPRMFKL